MMRLNIKNNIKYISNISDIILIIRNKFKLRTVINRII
ncbi:hypothetical protein SaO268_0027 [Staphylococcus aureus]|nr:hypothetical protein SaO268_0027 [Staphylococcus aureus]SCT56659.1 Uncharacterised protein [Staphylococcus aureus]SCT63680.1 Uncharacterised protein [Staphylococcus aureus]SCT80586.1 Uncharacterised protein [Staphylococcus aureus]SCT83737.1 Uncharacterised protein [Staphylococcus aureus]